MFVTAKGAAGGAARAVHLDHAGAQLGSHAAGALIAACLNVGGKAIRRVIRQFDGFILAIEGHDCQNRAKNLLAHNGHIGCRIGKDRRFHKPTTIESLWPANTAGYEACAFINTGLDQLLHLVKLCFRDKGTNVITTFAGHINLRCVGCRRCHFNRLVIGATLNQHPGCRVAGLTGIGKAEGRATGNRRLNIRVIKHQIG